LEINGKISSGTYFLDARFNCKLLLCPLHVIMPIVAVEDAW